MTPEERRRKLQEIAARVVERLDRAWPAEDAPLNDLEDLSDRVGREMMREVTEVLIQERSSRKPEHPATCPDCQRPARFAGYATQTYVTLHGPLPVRRAYFHCRPCGAGYAPLDDTWGLGPGHTSPSVQAIIADLATDPSYARTGRLRRQRRPFTVSVKTAEHIAQQVGAAVQADPPEIQTRATRLLAAAVDGVMAPTHAGCKEARAGVGYEPDWEAGRTPDACAGLRKEYVGTFASRESLVKEVCRRVERRRSTPATPVAALGDGAHWIWELFATHLPHRVEILDFYHACEHLATVAAAPFGTGTPEAQTWIRDMKKEWLESGPGELLRQLEAWTPTTEAAQEIRRQERGYFQNNRERMDYPRSLRAGWPIGSGAVEGACKHLVSARFKQAGMRWKPATGEPLLQLRAAVLTHPDVDLRAYVS